MRVVTRFYLTTRFAFGEVRGDVCAKLDAGLNAIMEGIPKGQFT